MQTCNRCLYNSLHPLHITFDSEGICSGCRVHQEKDEIDWRERGEKLRLIFNSYRNQSGKNYDCIVPVTGARDSYFIVDLVKNRYGMNPLLVTYNKHYNTAVGIRNLTNLRIRFGCDIMTLTVNPQTVKKITRTTLRRLGSMYWHCLAGQTVYPVQMAVKLKIPLIIWGAHQGIDQVGMFSHLDEVEMTRKYRKEHDLMGLEAEDLIDDFDNVTELDVSPYRYPDSRELEQVGVRGIYLNNYICWNTRLQHEEMIKRFGYETSPQTRTFDTYNDVDCWNYSDVHDYIKYLKHGYSKVVDHVCREIRLRQMSRQEGIELTKRYSTTSPKNLSLFLTWLGITENSFHYIINQHRNTLLWTRNDDWEWVPSQQFLELKYAVFGEKKELSESKTFTDFLVSPLGRSTDNQEGYILIGRGYF